MQLGIDDVAVRKLLLSIGKKGKGKGKAAGSPKSKKRPREADLDEPLPSGPSTFQISLDFKEELEVEVCRTS